MSYGGTQSKLFRMQLCGFMTLAAADYTAFDPCGSLSYYLTRHNRVQKARAIAARIGGCEASRGHMRAKIRGRPFNTFKILWARQCFITVKTRCGRIQPKGANLSVFSAFDSPVRLGFARIMLERGGVLKQTIMKDDKRLA